MESIPKQQSELIDSINLKRTEIMLTDHDQMTKSQTQIDKNDMNRNKSLAAPMQQNVPTDPGQPDSFKMPNKILDILTQNNSESVAGPMNDPFLDEFEDLEDEEFERLKQSQSGIPTT